MEKLCDKIRDSYDSLSTNVKLRNKKRALAEIDILAKKGNSVDLFEVKCSYRITKARKQAKLIRKHLRARVGNVYFYCGASESLVLL